MFNFQGDPDLFISSSVTGANVTLFAAGQISETAGGSITATNLVAFTELTGGGDITLNQPGANTVSGNVTLASLGDFGIGIEAGAISFTDTVGFTIAPSGVVPVLPSGVSTSGTATLVSGGQILETGSSPPAR